jgi:monoamine oxidase
MAGWSLAQQRVRVTILEAVATAGGRVDTLKPPHGFVEAGAELIGKNHPRWISLPHFFNLGLAPISGDDVYEAQHLKQPVVIGNRRLSGDAGDREEELIFRQMRWALSHLNCRANSVNPYEPWKARHAERWDRMTVGEWLDRLRGLRRATKSLLEFDLSTNQAVSIHRQS